MKKNINSVHFVQFLTRKILIRKCLILIKCSLLTSYTVSKILRQNEIRNVFTMHVKKEMVHKTRNVL